MIKMYKQQSLILLVELLFGCFSAFSRPLYITTEVKVSTSSQLEREYSCRYINDEIIAIHGQGVWLAKEKDARINIEAAFQD